MYSNISVCEVPSKYADLYKRVITYVPKQHNIHIGTEIIIIFIIIVILNKYKNYSFNSELLDDNSTFLEQDERISKPIKIVIQPQKIIGSFGTKKRCLSAFPKLMPIEKNDSMKDDDPELSIYVCVFLKNV